MMVRPERVVLRDPAATAAHAAQVALTVAPGDCLALDGELGAGKTTWVRGFVAALGGDPAAVSSPTYGLMHRYAANMPVAHIDAWRLARPGELLALGLQEFLDDGGVAVVEWASRAEGMLPMPLWRIALVDNGAAGRIVTCSPPRLP